jgi:hypothetical protein
MRWFSQSERSIDFPVRRGSHRFTLSDDGGRQPAQNANTVDQIRASEVGILSYQTMGRAGPAPPFTTAPAFRLTLRIMRSDFLRSRIIGSSG